MPGAYTHLFIADVIVDRLGNGRSQDDGTFEININPINNTDQPFQVLFDSKLADIIQRNPSSFRAGAVSPDFFPDVFTGIMISHQPHRRNKTMAEFMSSFADSVDLNDESQIAYWLGWFSHICTDVFGHHWVGMEANGDFETWISTAPSVIRKHLGTETVWDTWLRSLHGNPDLSFNRSLIIHAMLTDGIPLCDEHYNDEANQPIQTMILVNKLKQWHKEREKATERFRSSLPDPSFTDTLKQLCPVCATTGILSQTLKGPCDLCNAIGSISQAVQENCPQCNAVGFISQTFQENCPTCGAAGILRREIRGCILCKGSDKINDPVCGGSGKISKKIRFIGNISIPCPTCLGIGSIPCPHNAGDIVLRVLEETCPTCAGARLVTKLQDVTCPTCNGAKLLNAIKSVTCPRCSGSTLIDIIESIPCPVCVSGSTLTPLSLICDRLIEYHLRRQDNCQKLIESYLEAHEQVARCILENRMSEIPNSYEGFFDQVDEFIQTQLSFTDLVAPELVALEGKVRELVEKVLEELKNEFTPPWLIEFKRNLISELVDEVATSLNLKLSPAEEAHVLNTVQAFSPDGFPPLANAIKFFLISLNGATLTKDGLVEITNILNGTDQEKVANIDIRCQPFNTKLYCDLTFSWNKYFHDFLDGQVSYDHCDPKFDRRI
ncbi:MAG: zinc dependent phospholipase C family protein [Pseudanabaena sp. M165S2SP1A06QC]|nr:zinc dependent phospholipase C family protein [Pseudanabaena sp. M165S2SP1A06QC]